MYIFLSKIHFFMNDLNYIFEKWIIIVFFLVNIRIIWQDIYYRKIRNIDLVHLLLILPFWIYVYSVPISVLISHGAISWIILLWGILFYKHEGFIWAWDLKYAAILVLFTTGIPLSMIVGNIGILTLLVLLFWWSMICWYLYALRQYIPKYGIIPRIKWGKNKLNMLKQRQILDELKFRGFY